MGLKKINEDQVREIHARLSRGESSKVLSAEFGITQGNILRIAQGETWRKLCLPRIETNHFPTLNKRKPLETRLIEGMRVNPTTGCHEWQRCKNRGSYASIGVKGGTMLVHRASYMAFKGEIPEGRLVLHSCDNRLCINPEHLRIGNQADNMRDRSERGRCACQKGSAHGRAKLDDDDVRRIMERLQKGESASQVSKDYNVTAGNINFIRSGVSWNHVTGLPPKRKP
jgi:uncharacterized protein (DUF433 family)